MDWAKFRRLVDDTVARLRAADGDREKTEAAICRFLDRGYACGMSPAVLWDYFAVSSPSIPESAGYCGYECEKMVEVFARMSRAKFGDG